MDAIYSSTSGLDADEPIMARGLSASKEPFGRRCTSQVGAWPARIQRTPRGFDL
jgi:hypothetical protein